MAVNTQHRHRDHRPRQHGAVHHTHPAAPAVTPTYLRGIDVSHHNGTVDWNQVRAAGMTFALAKATDGKARHADHTFSANWAGIKAAGLIRGAWHFAHPGLKPDAAAEAKKFFKVVQPTHGDLPLILDLEKSDDLKPAAVWAWAKAFLAEVEALTGRPGIFYSYASFWIEDMGNPKDNLNCPLWLAAYVHHKPRIPRAWTDWTFWQYAQMVATPGTTKGAEQDYFRGTLADLQKLTLP
jgi:lysozyme